MSLPPISFSFSVIFVFIFILYLKLADDWIETRYWNPKFCRIESEVRLHTSCISYILKLNYNSIKISWLHYEHVSHRHCKGKFTLIRRMPSLLLFSVSLRFHLIAANKQSERWMGNTKSPFRKSISDFTSSRVNFVASKMKQRAQTAKCRKTEQMCEHTKTKPLWYGKKFWHIVKCDSFLLGVSVERLRCSALSLPNLELAPPANM